jgi:hypothetical protein
MNNIDPLRLLGALSAFCSLVLLLIRVGKEVQEIITLIMLGKENTQFPDGQSQKKRRPPKMKQSPTLFYELWFWGIVSAAFGGILWGFLWKQSIGGPGNEPHGIWAILWPLFTILPGLLVLAILNWKYQFLPWKIYCMSLIPWIVGTMIGSWIFYNLPINGFIGFREYIQSSSTELQEFWLAIIWSTLISFPAFLCLTIFQFRRSNFSAAIKRLWSSLIQPSGLTVVITTLAVGLFLLVYPDQTKFDQARGIVAGLALRTMLFVTLFLASLAPLRLKKPANSSRIGN